MVPLGLQNVSLIGRFCVLFGESFKRGSTVFFNSCLIELRYAKNGAKGYQSLSPKWVGCMCTCVKWGSVNQLASLDPIQKTFKKIS